METISNKMIEDSINNAISNITPNAFNEVSISILERENKMKNKKFKNNHFCFMKYALPLCLIVIAIVGYGYYNKNLVTDSIIAIDVNPSIELKVSRNNKVISAKGINEGGKTIIGDMNLKRINLDVALNAITGSMITNGYLTLDDANILVSVENDNLVKADKLRAIIVSNIEKMLREEKSNITTMVINQTISENKNERKTTSTIASSYNISHGKAVFISNLIKKNSTLKLEDLANMSLKDIAALIDRKKIDISDIVDFDTDDSTYENIEESIKDINEDNIDYNANYIGSAKAKTIALAHAKINVLNVTYIKSELDDDDKLVKYEVEFKASNTKYEYDIDALTGEIISSVTEVGDNNDDDNDDVDQQTTYIGTTKAKEISTNHAKLSNVTFTKAVLDTEDNVKVYEIKFIANGDEYEYIINAKTGKIVDFNIEINDDNDTDDDDSDDDDND